MSTNLHQSTTTDCSACRTDLVLTFAPSGTHGTVTAHIPSNGIRGDKHVPAHDETVEFIVEDEECLAVWECPACGHADSLDLVEGGLA